ncbi:MAG: helix-turn-helix transcriptional regulator [Clostridia bacterium]|nr:helix-turn-helix transcriptional regulator [Clostridia bacterium]
MNSICRFLPVKNDNGSLKTVHFVYETEWKRLRQPQIQPIYYLFLVKRGSGQVRLPEFGTFQISVGSLFLIAPAVRYEITGSDDLSYFYISFMGTRAPELAGELSNTVYNGYDSLIPLWLQSIQRLNAVNGNLLTEGVLLFTLSYLTDNTAEENADKSDTLLKNIVDYLDHHYKDPTLNLKKVADIFGYTDKYLSHLFKSSMNVNWTVYLNRLRIQHAIELLEQGHSNTAELAFACGYSDPMYFSKVFKKMTGKTPKRYRENKQ